MKGAAAFIAVLVVIGMVFVGGCGAMVGPEASESLLRSQGFESIRQVDKDVFFVELRGCSDKDNARFTFEATNPRGQRVRLTTCDGVIRGATLRN